MPIINSFSGASARAYGLTGGAKKIVLFASPAPSATVTTYDDYIVFKFTSTGTLEVGSGAPGAGDVLLVGGGSNGAAGSPNVAPGLPGGNGGSGGAIYTTSGTSIIGGSPIPVVIGGAGTNTTFGPLTSSGGSQASGGAAGVQAPSPFPSVGTPGSAGTANAYETGSPITYGGGGGGGGSGSVYPADAYAGNPGGSGGAGGGGAGGRGARNLPNLVNNYVPDIPSTPGIAGTVNLGGGGGGGGGAHSTYPQSPGGNGGSGVAIIRFPTAQFETAA